MPPCITGLLSSPKGEAPLDRIPVFVRAGSILPLNLGANSKLGDDVGNAVDRYRSLSFWLYPQGRCSTRWTDAKGRHYTI